jgi:hypothetical protein
MGLSTIRKATDDDIENVNAAWGRFYDRHPELFTDPTFPGEMGNMADDTAYEEALWQRCIMRTLGLSGSVDIKHPVCIAYGYVGESGW